MDQPGPSRGGSGDGVQSDLGRRGGGDDLERAGLHCYIPVVRRYAVDEVRALAETTGQFLAAIRPRDITLDWAVGARAGRVFVDFNQNLRGKSLAAAYSPRRHPLGTVSMPLTWSALPQAYPTDFTLRTLPDLLDEGGDAWGGILHAKEDLETVLGAVAGAGADPE